METKSHKKGVKVFLFFNNWLFLVFAGKHFFAPPINNIDFIIKNLGTFIGASTVTAVMLATISEKALRLVAGGMLILAVLIAVY